MRLVAIVLVVGCSSPPSKPVEQPWTPPDDEEQTVAWQKAHPPPPPEYRFDWDKVRASNEEWLSKPVGQFGPCDPRIKVNMPGQECLRGPFKLQIAAKIHNARAAGHNDHVQFVIDRGSDATLTTAWFAAILDDHGRPLTPWVHFDRVDVEHAMFTLPLPLPGVTTASGAHVAVVQEVPQETPK